jgi:hypothetical protein
MVDRDCELISATEHDDILSELFLSAFTVSAEPALSAPAMYPDDFEGDDQVVRETLESLIEPDSVVDPAPGADMVDKKSWRRASPGMVDVQREGTFSPSRAYDFIASRFANKPAGQAERLVMKKYLEYLWDSTPVQTVAERMGYIDRAFHSDHCAIKGGTGWAGYVATWPKTTRRALSPSVGVLEVSVDTNDVTNAVDTEYFSPPFPHEKLGTEVFSEVLHAVVSQCDDLQVLMAQGGKCFMRRHKRGGRPNISDESNLQCDAQFVEELRCVTDFAGTRALYADRLVKRDLSGRYADRSFPEILPYVPGITVQYLMDELEGAMVKGHHKSKVVRPPARLNRYKVAGMSSLLPIEVLPEDDCQGSIIRHAIITEDEVERCQKTIYPLRLTVDPAENAIKARAYGKITSGTDSDAEGSLLSYCRTGVTPHITCDPNKDVIAKTLSRGFSDRNRSCVFIARRDGNERRGHIVDKGQFAVHVKSKADMALCEVIRSRQWRGRRGDGPLPPIVVRIDIKNAPSPLIYQTTIDYTIPNIIGSCRNLTDDLCFEPRGTFLLDEDIINLSTVSGRINRVATWPGHRLGNRKGKPWLHDNVLVGGSVKRNNTFRKLDTSFL